MPIMPSADNYVNMPQQKMSKCDKKRNPYEFQNENGNISNPHCVSTNGPEEELNHKTSPHSAKFGNELNCKSPPNGLKYQNAFLNPTYQSQIKANNDTSVNITDHDCKTSDASSDFQSGVDLFVT
jgi:hypothetical protein